jgi:hypothetical protein
MNSTPPYIWFLIPAGLIAFALLCRALYYRDRDGEWHPVEVDQMRRRKDGQWEYRLMTEQERLEKQENEAW